MALVFLALNGVGLGHLVRATSVCRALAAAGERPVIFSQGMFPLDDGTEFPGKAVPSLWRTEPAVRVRVAAEIESMAGISEPAVLVEDTHPNPIVVRGIRRVLVVRPTTFAYLEELNAQHGRLYAAFVLCDAPDSPTWPYSAAETEALATWPKWHVREPIFRRAAPEDVERLRRDYAVDGRRLYVFSMGGGGEHQADERDSGRFVAFADRIADEILRVDREARLLFVRGPYFPSDVRVPARFEVVDQESRMPSLLALAHVAVVRAGFNTIWECIAGRTPFVPFVGETFAEPTTERLARLDEHGLLAVDPAVACGDDAWRTGFAARCRETCERFSGVPDGTALRELVLGPERRGPLRVVRPSRRHWSGFRALRRSRPGLVVRVDDVVSLEGSLAWVLSLLVARRLRASLEVVPYLTDLDERLLTRLDPTATFLEVSQHGFAHVPRSDADGFRHEFAPESVAPEPHEVEQIRTGRALLQAAFPARFVDGFSAPFDALPAWLPSVWADAGGAFVSHLGTRPVGPASLPLVRAGSDIWDWRVHRSRPRRELLGELRLCAREFGFAGIALHPRCLRLREQRAELVALLDRLDARGFTPVSLRDTALRS